MKGCEECGKPIGAGSYCLYHLVDAKGKERTSNKNNWLNRIICKLIWHDFFVYENGCHECRRCGKVVGIKPKRLRK